MKFSFTFEYSDPAVVLRLAADLVGIVSETLGVSYDHKGTMTMAVDDAPASIVEFVSRTESSALDPEPAAEVDADLAGKLNIEITDLGLSRRASFCLAKAKIYTVGDLVVKTEDDLRNIVNFGPASVRAVQGSLLGLGLTLKQK